MILKLLLQFVFLINLFFINSIINSLNQLWSFLRITISSFLSFNKLFQFKIFISLLLNFIEIKSFWRPIHWLFNRLFNWPWICYSSKIIITFLYSTWTEAVVGPVFAAVSNCVHLFEWTCLTNWFVFTTLLVFFEIRLSFWLSCKRLL